MKLVWIWCRSNRSGYCPKPLHL